MQDDSKQHAAEAAMAVVCSEPHPAPPACLGSNVDINLAASACSKLACHSVGARVIPACLQCFRWTWQYVIGFTIVTRLHRHTSKQEMLHRGAEVWFAVVIRRQDALDCCWSVYPLAWLLE